MIFFLLKKKLEAMLLLGETNRKEFKFSYFKKEKITKNLSW